MSKITSSEFWGKMRFKYKISFLNENTLEEVFALRLSRLSGLLTVAIAAIVLIALTSVVIIKTPIRNYLPGYLNSEIRSEMIQNALKVDSLERKLLVQTKYLNNVSAILRGDMEIDKVAMIDTLRESENLDLGKSKVTADFVKKYEEDEKYHILQGAAKETPAAEIKAYSPMFYKPVKGMISAHFDLSAKHFGVDVATRVNEPVIAVLKGTVIFSGFDTNTGYVINIQHNNGFTSIYRHNARLLKKQGDEVKTGETIALAGNTGALTSGNHLHFELWYNGKPVNPEDFIAF